MKPEKASQQEFDGLLRSALVRLKDSTNEVLSFDSRFDLAYNAAHAFSLAALRWHGYRPDNRYIVFQCLEHTLGLEKSKCRVLSTCHNKRNKAEYDGILEVTEVLLESLIAIVKELEEKTKELAAIEE